MLNLKNLSQNTKSEPYRKAFNRSSSSKLIIKGSITESLSWRFCVWPRRNGQYKKKVFNCFDFSTTVTHGAYKIFELMTGFMII